MTGLNDFCDDVRRTFTYDNGVLRWKVAHGQRGQVGAIAGSKGLEGYVKVKWNRRMYQAHRLIFAFHHSWLPEEVDHINGDRSDNRIENLRAATKSLNQRNAKRRADNRSGVKGVCWCERDQRWIATVYRNRKIIYQRYFRDLTDAAQAVQKAREDAHGEFARHA
jgi:hypothetical protein